MRPSQSRAAHLLVKIVGPCQIIDGGIDSPAEILEDHGEGLIKPVTKTEKKSRKADNSRGMRVLTVPMTGGN